jgi:hypothetical protein
MERWAGWDEGLPGKRRILERLCEEARRRNRPFDVLVPLSGGKDSTYVLYRAVRELHLKCIAFTLDNGYLTDHARANIERACRTLGVEHVYYRMDPQFINELFALFMRKTGYFCSVCMRAIGMATERVADMYDVPLVFGGSSSRTELPLSTEMFQAGPVQYMKNVLKGESVSASAGRLLYEGSFRRRVGYRLFWWGSQRHLGRYAWINLPDYMDWDYATISRTIQDELGWRVPEGEWDHTDCSIHSITTYMHDRRFPGLEIERLTLARLVQAGQVTREEALTSVERRVPRDPPASVMDDFLKGLGMSRDEFDRLVARGPRHIGFRPRTSAVLGAAGALKRSVFRALGVRR